MKISLLSYSLSHNCLGRAYILAEVLKRRYEVEIIGPDVSGIWRPVNDGSIKIKKVGAGNFPGFHRSIKKMLDLIDGDVIYAVKIRPTSFGVGVMKKILTGKPLVLDIDDNEDAFADPKEPSDSQVRRPDSNLYVQMTKKLTGYADAFTYVSEYLKSYYGVDGALVPHGRDGVLFNPALYDKEKRKKELGLEKYKLVMFSGSARPHKGIEELIAAVRQLGRADVKIVFLGLESGHLDAPYLKRLISKNRDIAVGFKQALFRDVPKYLCIADWVVLPQREEPRTLGQVPAKMIDAMAMALPIISTHVSEIPRILAGSGIVVEPGNVDALSRALKELIDDPQRSLALGLAARKKFEKEYSYDVMERTLVNIFSRFEGK